MSHQTVTKSTLKPIRIIIAYILFAIVLIVVCIAVISFNNRNMVIRVDISGKSHELSDYCMVLEQDEEYFIAHDLYISGDELIFNLDAVKPGIAFVDLKCGEELLGCDMFYSHHFGIITRNTFFGKSNGDIVIPISIILFLGTIIIRLFMQLRKDVRENFYQYKNVRTLGIIIFLVFVFLEQLMTPVNYDGLDETMRVTLGTASIISIFVLPVAFVMFILVSITNVQLMLKEGKNWRNMLGFFLGILLCFITLIPHFINQFLQNATFVDVHRESGIATHVDLFLENLIPLVAAYLECILVATIIFAVRAAKHIPSFDKDYILILGCQIKKDGSLTNLLKGRADRAIEFARLQKENTGKDIIFVPSGGQGSDEVISEGEAIRNYLIDEGIEEERILLEDKSTSTYENFKFSNDRIMESREGDKSAPRIAFSTTNYHVFRSGMLAAEQGINAEGIGSTTRRYFWINAFIREFIATIITERRSHIFINVIVTIIMLLLVFAIYYSRQF